MAEEDTKDLDASIKTMCVSLARIESFMAEIAIRGCAIGDKERHEVYKYIDGQSSTTHIRIRDNTASLTLLIETNKKELEAKIAGQTRLLKYLSALSFSLGASSTWIINKLNH